MAPADNQPPSFNRGTPDLDPDNKGSTPLGGSIRPGKFKHDLTSRRYGRLVVLSFAGVDIHTNKGLWDCLCDCGTVKLIDTGSLNMGHSVSCGCWKYERIGLNAKYRDRSKDKKAPQ